MNWDRIIYIIQALLDAGILYILIIEFDYDKTIYEKEQFKKLRRKPKLLLPEQPLTDGESK